MLSNILSQKRDILAIEIGECYLKIAQCVLGKDGAQIAGVLSLDRTELTEEEISDAIRNFAKKAGIKNPTTINVVPSHYAIFKNIEIPSIDKQEIKEIVDLQAGRHTPYSRDEIIMNYVEIGIVHERYTKILLVIVKREEVSKRYEVIRGAGFKANEAVLSSDGVNAWFARNCLDSSISMPVGIVHIDSHAVDFSVVHRSNSIYFRSFPVDVINIAKQDSNVKKTLMDEIKKSLESYQAENIESIPAKIYFSGVVEDIASLLGEIKALINIDPEIVPYVKRFNLTQNAERECHENKSVSLLSVLAAPVVLEDLALSLVPEDIRVRNAIKGKAREFTKAGILGLFSLVIFCTMLITNYAFKNMYFEKLLKKYTKENVKAQRLKEISDRTGLIKKFLSRKGRALDVLVELFNAIPDEVFLSSISFKEDTKIIFTGTADSMSLVFSLVTDLENNDFFKTVKLDFSKTRIFKKKEVADFGLTITIEGEGPEEEESGAGEEE